MRSFFHEVREFFSALFEKAKPQYIGFLRMPSLKNEESKRAKSQLGFRK